MADYIGVSYHTYNSWEKGTRKPHGSGARLVNVLQMVEIMCPAVHDQLRGRVE